MNVPAYPDHPVQVALAALAPRLHPSATTISNLTRLSGGATQEIWRFDLNTADGARRLILRRAPGGDRLNDMGIALETEAQLIQAAAAAGVPVPVVMYVASPEDGLGHGFLMNFIEGETLGGRIVKADRFAETRRHLARQCGEVLARIHSIAPDEFATLRPQSPGELVDEWRENYRATGLRRPVFDAVIHFLKSTAPPPSPNPRLVHGDFRNGNLMIGEEGIRAVLDWELAHVGDPMEDLGWLCVNSWRFGAIDKPVGGFGSYDDLYAGYEAISGHPVNRETARWWEIFGTLRWGVVCASSLVTFRDVEHTVDRAVIARRASETEIDLLRLLEN